MMKNNKFILLLFLLPLFIQGCQKFEEYPENLKPVYSDFDNDLEKQNLFGNVKTIKQYRTKFEDEIDKKTDIVSEIEFTEYGNVMVKKSYNEEGDLSQIDSFEYDSNNKVSKMSSDMIYANTKFNSEFKKTDSGKIEHQEFYDGENLLEKNSVFYDKEENPIKHISVRYENGNKDTTKTKLESKTENKNVVHRETKIKNLDEWITQEVRNYKYDQNGNLIVEIFEDKLSKIKSIDSIKWSNDKITEELNYTVQNNETKELQSKVKYNDIFNTVSEEHFNPFYKLKNVYNFYDREGNWIRKTIYRTDDKQKSNKYNPMYIEERELTYW